MNEWQGFFIAQVGASAALTGLLFVGVSINLARILAVPMLADLAFAALFLLSAVLVGSSFMLVPGQSLLVMGLEMLLMGLGAWVVISVLDVNIWKHSDFKYRGGSALLILFNQIAVLSYLIAGVILLLGNLAGVYWLVPAVLFSFLEALWNAWLLLVEINR